MKYLSIALLSISSFGLGTALPSPSAADAPQVTTTTTTLEVGASWNPASLLTPPVAPPSLTNINEPATTTTIFSPPLVSSEIMAKWEKVAQCEQGGNWHARGPIYSGGLGILETNWVKYGGLKLFGPLYAASSEQQVFIARKIQAAAGIPEYVPNQFGCGGGW
jgi:hypothetical protein